MEFQHALETANEAVLAYRGSALNKLEVALLDGVWHEQTYQEIADALGYSVTYVAQDTGPKFWKLLSQALGARVTKTNVRTVLGRCWQEKWREGAGERFASTSAPDPTTHTDWGDAIDIRSFHGRSQELATLEQWIRQDHCRLITLLGIGGVGKSSLAVKLAHQLVGSGGTEGQILPHHPSTSPPTHSFDYVIWRSLRNAPSLETLLADLVLFLSHQQEPHGGLNQLLRYFRSARCLLILDNVETVFQEGDRAGHYRAGYENYGELWQVIGKTAHQSCVILTSREKPLELLEMEGMDAPVRSLQLSGSIEITQPILQQELIGSGTQCQRLSERYSHNPLALKVVSSIIHELFDGEIELFLEQNASLFNGIHRLLEQQFERLSYLEQVIMYWLAINREWTTIAELVEDIIPAVSRTQLLESLESLKWRSLIETRAGRYTQQPVVMEYVSNRLIEKISRELNTTELAAFLRYALIKTTAKDYIRETQVRLILQPIADQFRSTFSSQAALNQQILKLLLRIRQTEATCSGYGAGNLINLCCHLNLDLTGFDFSNLTLRQAYLRDANFHHVNFSQSRFDRSDFIQNFTAIFSTALSRDGKWMATGEYDGHVRLWRIADTQLIRSISAHNNWVWATHFSPDNSTLVTASADRLIKLWDVQTGQLLRTIQESMSVMTVRFSPDGRLLASGGADCAVKLWDVRTGELVATMQGHDKWVWSVCFSADGTTLVSGGDDCIIKLWDVETGRLLRALEGHDHWVWSVCFSPDDRIVASGSYDHTVKLWDISTGKLLHTLRGHQDWVGSVSFSPDGTLLASSSHDHTVRLWDVETGSLLNTLPGHQDCVLSVGFSPDGRVLTSSGADCTVKFWDVQTKQLLNSLQGYTNWVWSIDFSSDGRWLASGSADHTVKLWDLNTGKRSATLLGHRGWVLSVRFSPDGRLLASASADYRIKLWDSQTGKLLRTFQGHTDWVLSIDFNPTGTMLVSGSYDGTIRLWDVQTGNPMRPLQSAGNWVLAVAFNPDGTTLASGNADGTVNLWDVPSREVLQTLSGHTSAVWGIAFAPDGKTLATSSEDYMVKLWDTQDGKLLRTFIGHQNWVMSVQFSPDGTQLVSGSKDSTAKLWDVQTGECLHTLQDHSDCILSVSFHPAGEQLATSSANETIKLWNSKTGTCLGALRTNRPYEGMNITGITGLTEAQKTILSALGAIETDL
ncbi:MAG: pentapeptide repeat-containing protein [Elainella sp. C42_A2020_010]|nr:pentapeptide repeat-containing protein [Elainella sp. C42_A2020_010]